MQELLQLELNNKKTLCQVLERDSKNCAPFYTRGLVIQGLQLKLRRKSFMIN